MTRAAALLLLALLGCASSSSARRAGENCAWRVCVQHQDLRTGRTYRVTNREPVPVTVRLTFRSVDNLRRPPAPVERIVPPESTEQLAHLRAIRGGRRVGARVAVAIDLGSSSTEPDEYSYAVPFAGSSPRTLIQGFDGSDTHVGGMRYSLDFAMPEGTPVVAARGGKVLYVQDGFTRGGTDPELLERSNLVVVAHEDGTMASYGHLSPGIEVRVGDPVVEGQRLGRSGATGFAGRPHLHFHVGVRMLGDPGRTIPFTLKDETGRTLDLEVGGLVEPTGVQASLPGCDSADADAWVTEQRDRVLEFNDLADFAAARFGGPLDCRGAVTGDFDGASYGLVVLSFGDGVTLEVETMPPQVSIVTLRSPTGFEDQESVKAALASYAEGVGLDIDWAAPPEEASSGGERTEQFWDPEPGLNGSGAHIYRGDALVAIRFSMAP